MNKNNDVISTPRKKNYFTISIPISPNVNSSKIKRLNQIARRDHAVAKYITYVINENKRFLVSKYKRINKQKLNNILLTTKKRKYVKYDLKKQFKGKAKEFQEIRDHAVEMYHTYLKNRETQIPFSNSNKSNISSTRRINNIRISENNKLQAAAGKIFYDPTNKISKLWVQVSDPFHYKTLKIPLKFGEKLFEYMNKFFFNFNDIRTFNFTSLRSKSWVCNLTFVTDTVRNVAPIIPVQHINSSTGDVKFLTNSKTSVIPFCPSNSNNIVILGLDPGITRPYTGYWLTPDGIKRKYERFYNIPEFETLIYRIDKRIAERQNKLNTIKNNTDIPYARTTQLKNALHRDYDKRIAIRKEAEYHLSNFLLAEVLQWEKKGWKVHVAVGYPKHINKRLSIRNSSSNHRKMPKVARRRQHRWRYSSRIALLKRKFNSYGLKDRVIATPEYFTSRTCPRCSVLELRKFKTMSLNKKYGNVLRHGGWFECLKCKFKCNADVAGAINIARACLLTKIFNPSKKKLLEIQRRKNWWIYENNFNLRLKRYNEYLQSKRGFKDIKNGKLRSKPTKPKWQEWSIIKTKKNWQLKELHWYNHSIKQVPEEWQPWVQNLTQVSIPI